MRVGGSPPAGPCLTVAACPCRLACLNHVEAT
jgi:hypothetical protein